MISKIEGMGTPDMNCEEDYSWHQPITDFLEICYLGILVHIMIQHHVLVNFTPKH